jgi:hypothetical protein
VSPCRSPGLTDRCSVGGGADAAEVDAKHDVSETRRRYSAVLRVVRGVRGVRGARTSGAPVVAILLAFVQGFPSGNRGLFLVQAMHASSPPPRVCSETRWWASTNAQKQLGPRRILSDRLHTRHRHQHTHQHTHHLPTTHSTTHIDTTHSTTRPRIRHPIRAPAPSPEKADASPPHCHGLCLSCVCCCGTSHP